MATIINIVSGKGGTGKTLFSAILAEMLGNANAPTLVIDMDIFVRGLTALLFFHRGESFRLTRGDEWPVSAFFLQKEAVLQEFLSPVLGTHKYRSFDVSPSVHSIDEIINLNDISPDTRDEAEAILVKMLHSAPPRYKYIILDSRAGYDELISATHRISDFSICVQEEDEISNVTADNLVRQLEMETAKKVYRLINKARGINSSDDLERYPRATFNFIGAIPFDMDVMNSFGRQTFWEDISRSLYRAAVARTWNLLAKRLDFEDKLPEVRMSPLGSNRIESKFGIYSTRNRVLLLYGSFLSVLGLLLSVTGSDIFFYFKSDPFRLVSLIVGMGGLLIVLFVVLREPSR